MYTLLFYYLLLGQLPTWPVFLMILFIGWMASVGPDIDLVRLAWHRNWFTHSCAVPIILWIINIMTIQINITWFFVMWGSHLFSDLFPHSRKWQTWQNFFTARAPTGIRFGYGHNMGQRAAFLYLVIHCAVLVIWLCFIL